DRLAPAEADGVLVLHDLVPALAELLLVGPQPGLQRQLELRADAVHTEARLVQRSLRVEAAVDDRGDQLQVALWLDVAAHAAEGADQAAVAHQHAGDDRVERPPSGRKPVRVPPREREARAAVLERDAGVGGADAGAEAVVQALDEGARHAPLVHHAEVDGAARRQLARARRAGGARLEQAARGSGAG